MTIDIDLDTLDQVSKRTKELEGDINSCAGRIDGISQDVSAAWQSDNSGAYVNEIEETARRLRILSQSMGTLSNAISQYTNNM